MLSFRAPSLLVLLLTASCASAPLSSSSQTFRGKDDVYQLTLGAGFRPYLLGAQSFDGIWRSRSGTHFVAVALSEKSDLDALGEQVRQRATDAGYDEMEILDVVDTTVDGLPARRTQIALRSGETDFVMWNTHVVTPLANLQIISWGPRARADALRSTVLAIERRGLRLLRAVSSEHD